MYEERNRNISILIMVLWRTDSLLWKGGRATKLPIQLEDQESRMRTRSNAAYCGVRLTVGRYS